MKRTAIKRKTPLRAKPGPRAPRQPTKYKSRPRDTEYMLWVKTRPCWAQALSRCGGPVEADHAGSRGIGRKADDDTCIPLCTHHHRARTDFSGPFRGWNQAEMRAWLGAAVEYHRSAWKINRDLY